MESNLVDETLTDSTVLVQVFTEPFSYTVRLSILQLLRMNSMGNLKQLIQESQTNYNIGYLKYSHNFYLPLVLVWMKIPEKLIFEELSKIIMGVWEITAHSDIRFARVCCYSFELGIAWRTFTLADYLY